MSSTISGWLAQLRPASFAGVGFFVRVQKAEGGQRLVIQEIPFGAADLQNQGLLPDKFTVTCYFIGAGWLSARESFLATLKNTTTPATLVLPTKGPLTVMVSNFSYQDDENIGGYGEIDVSFVVAAGVAAPFSANNFASQLLNAVSNVTAQIETAYQNLMGPIIQNAAIAQYAAGLLISAGEAVIALPAALLAGVASLVSAPSLNSLAPAVTPQQAGTNAAIALVFAASPANTAATAQAVTTALMAASDNAVAVANPVVTATDAITGISPAASLPADPSLGIAALGGWGASLPAPAALPAGLLTAQTAVVLLVQTSAGLALAALYAQTDFATQQAASAARGQLVSVMDSVAASIANAMLPDLYRAWTALQAMAVRDALARAQNLPSLAQYSLGASLPDVVVAQMLLQDGSQGDAIFAANNAIHPLFMPLAGVYLEAA